MSPPHSQSSKCVSIYARKRWNNTGFALYEGKTYHFKAEGRWWDFYIPTDPSGFSKEWLRKFENERRVPDAKWFALIGSIDQSKQSTFIINSDRKYTANSTGELTCYANDKPSMYWNNWGKIKLTIEPL